MEEIDEITKSLERRVTRLESLTQDIRRLLYGPPDRPQDGMGSRVNEVEKHLHEIRDTSKWILRLLIAIGVGVLVKAVFG